MMRLFLLLSLFLASLLIQGCNSINGDASLPKMETGIVQQISNDFDKQDDGILLPSDGKVNFEGVSFSYNSQVFQIKAKNIVHESPLQSEMDKPGNNFPRHVAFYVKNNVLEDDSTIRIIPIEDYRRMYAVSKNYQKSFDEKVQQVWKSLKNKHYRDKSRLEQGEIPLIPFWQEGQEFLAKIEHLPFQNGKGIVLLTQFTYEVTLINNEGLQYLYEGITDDGKYYILAEMPVNASFLPKENDLFEFEGYKIPKSGVLKTDKELKRHRNYVSGIAKRLENLPKDKFEPNLNYFEELISSIRVEK